MSSYEDLEEMVYSGQWDPVGAGLVFDDQRLNAAMKAIYQQNTTNLNRDTYSEVRMDWLAWNDKKIFNMLKKSTFQDEGDAIQIVSAKPSSGGYVTDGTDTLPTSGAATLGVYTGIPHAMYAEVVEQSIGDVIQESWAKRPYTRALNWQQMIELHEKEFWESIDNELCSDGDTPFDAASIESLDRIITNFTEANTLWTLSDSRLYGQAQWEAASGGVREAQVSVNAGTLRTLKPEDIDDVVSDCLTYAASANRDYLMLTTPKTLNNLENEYRGTIRYSDPAKFKVSVGEGLNTRTGVNIGMPIATFTGGGLDDVPIATATNVHAETGGGGNWYIIDRNEIKWRGSYPYKWMEVPEGSGWLTREKLRRYGAHFIAGQLVPTKIRSSGAVKYITA